LKLADQELARAIQMATQMLRFQKQSTAPVLVDPCEIMDRALAMYGPRLSANSVTVVREYLTHEKLHCLDDELRQVFANLISNSLDAIKGGGRLRVRIKSVRKWDDARIPMIRITVADTGEGIPLEVQKRVFEPFVSTKENTGTGLGLWVSEEIIKKHNGRIAMRSCTGLARHGTVFSLLLPLTTLGE
jgi:signal transduction histidine kinase